METEEYRLTNDPRFSRFIELFNTEKFFEAHEVLEELWLETSGDKKRYLQSLIQCAVAFAHIQRNNPRGAIQVWKRALDGLSGSATRVKEIALDKLIEACERFFEGKTSNFPKIQTRKG